MLSKIDSDNCFHSYINIYRFGHIYQYRHKASICISEYIGYIGRIGRIGRRRCIQTYSEYMVIWVSLSAYRVLTGDVKGMGTLFKDAQI